MTTSSPVSAALEEIITPPVQAEPVRVALPAIPVHVDQDQEWFEYEAGGEKHRVRVHDYAALYRTPGLYEALVYDALECRSPEYVTRPLCNALAESDAGPGDLRVLDLGAGNGIVGELLRRVGVERVVGVDIIDEAADAARRDRPGTYEDYFVTDLTKHDPDAEQRLTEFEPNCLVTVAALGYGDIPPEAFVKAFNLLPRDGWLAMCIKDRFLEEDDDSGFGRLVRGMVKDGTIDVLHRERYVHRRAVAGKELYYVALVARKGRDVDFAG